MGLNINGTQCILYAKTLGVDFTRTMMIGRQELHLSQSEFKENLLQFGFPFEDKSIGHIFTKSNHYAEEFFRYLGANEVHSLDNTNYEGATHVHDMNLPISECLKQQYSVVLDGGTLEHIFNFPVAIRNCMEMVQVGGYYLGITPANNFMGHGFYQFSPEVFFSVFTRTNGYALDRIIAFEDSPQAEWYLVKSPESIKGRVTLTNGKPVYLLIVAKRTEDIEPLQAMPQQSDYVSIWDQASSGTDAAATEQHEAAAKRGALTALMLRYTPQTIKRIAKRLLRYSQRHMEFDPRFFQPIVRTDGTKSTN